MSITRGDRSLISFSALGSVVASGKDELLGSRSDHAGETASASGEVGRIELFEGLRPSINPRAVWGLYCSWAMVGILYGFVSNYINIPICEYVFGPMDAPGRTTTAQCNIAPTITCIPWNLQVFYGLVLDRVGLFGTRRAGWIKCGWTMALTVLCILCFFVDDLVKKGQFFTYMILLMSMCFFYIFATVSCDAATIEFGKLEPPESRGYILTTGQMTRFGATVLVNGLGILGMNGRYYYPANSDGNSTVFSFELKFWQVHLVLAIITVPFYVAMLFLLEDPPWSAAEKHHNVKEVCLQLWDVLQTRVMLCLIIFGIGSMSIGSMSNPAANIIAFIAAPSTFQSSLGTFAGNLMFLGGVWIFRRFLMGRNWRYTFIGTTTVLAMNGFFQLLVISNAWGIGQSGWFYAFGSNVLMVVQGIAQVLASLSVMEIAPAGFEASIYEFLTSIQNSGITLNANFQNMLLPLFKLNGIASVYRTDLANRLEYDTWLAFSTYFTIGVNFVGALCFCWFLPKDKAQCRVWLGQWRRPGVGVFNLVLGGGVLFFSIMVSVLSGLPATDCLKIAGGSGC